jgi:4-alpha-glucanotransferase
MRRNVEVAVPVTNTMLAVLPRTAAVADPEGINFPGIISTYQSLRWRDWDNEHLDTKLRDAIKNLRKIEGDNLTHTGEKRGKYKIINP